MGNGPSFVAQDVFNDVVFGGDPSTGPSGWKYDEKTRELWKNSLDDWGNPLRPANLNRGVYKGGRRPIDIYWRIAKGINGAKMPAHYPTHRARADLGPGQLRARPALRAQAARRSQLPAAPPAGARRWPGS